MATESREFVEPFYASLAEFFSTEINYPRYLELLEQGVRAGDDNAAYALGSLLVHGGGGDGKAIKTNVKRGVRLIEAATRSVHLAMVEMATFCESGEFGVSKNEKRAHALFRKAVEHGSVVARYHLGRCSYFGIGTKVDKRRARTLFRAAARLGFAAWEHDGSAK